MNRVFCLIFCLSTIFYSGNSMAQQAMAQDALIALTAEQEPLSDILKTITQETGYTFNLNKAWRDYPVSATIDNLPIDKGLKRLLRSLNHTIIWESDRVITIKIFSKVDPKRPNPAVSPSFSPPTYQVTPEPIVEPEKESADQVDAVDVEVEETDSGEEEAEPETDDEESTSLQDNPNQPLE